MFLDIAFNRLNKIKSNGHTVRVAKAISWRIVGTLDTFVISFLVTGKINLATAIASVEVITKSPCFIFLKGHG